MLGYSKYWTAGFTAYQWWGLFHKVNVTEFDIIHIGFERDRVCRSYMVPSAGSALLAVH